MILQTPLLILSLALLGSSVPSSPSPSSTTTTSSPALATSPNDQHRVIGNPIEGNLHFARHAPRGGWGGGGGRGQWKQKQAQAQKQQQQPQSQPDSSSSGGDSGENPYAAQAQQAEPQQEQQQSQNSNSGGSGGGSGGRSKWGGKKGGQQQQQSAGDETQQQEQPQSQQKQQQSNPKGQQQQQSSGSNSNNPVPAAGGSSGGGGGGPGYMSIVSKWRSTMGLSALSQDSKLEANALDTSVSANGALKHKLNTGSMGQVMAPGDAGNFEKVFVGGWLCEIPSLPGLGSVCGSMSKGWNHAGQTGHAKILSDPKYKKIGCGLAKGVWTCDLA